MATFTLNGEPIPHAPFVLGEGEAAIHYPANVLDLWSDEDLAAIGVVRTPDPAPEPPPPPVIVSRMQLRRQLLRMPRTDAGSGTLLAQIDTAVAAAAATETLQGLDLQEYWTNTSEFHRDHPTLIAFAASQGIDEAALAAAFTAAAALT